MIFINTILEKFFHKRSFRRFLLLSFDLSIIYLSFLITFWITGEYEIIFQKSTYLNALLINGSLLFLFTGQYKGITRFNGSVSIYFLVIRVFSLLFLMNIYSFFTDIPFLGYKKLIILFILISYLLSFLRIIFRDLILKSRKNFNLDTPKVAIYGAGEAGTQLYASLKIAASHDIQCFFDDNDSLWYRSIDGKIIKPANEIDNLKDKFDQILLAIPSLDFQRRIEIIKKMQSLNISILEIPSLDDLTSGKAKINNLKKINIEDLLSRKKVSPITELLDKSVSNKIVCITGAGGSIGSELCRQILTLNPKKLIIVDNSEKNLYLINQELSYFKNKKRIIIKLGNTSSKLFVKYLFKQYKIDILFHAAAYKHVPLVEINSIEAVFNNVFSTLYLCQEAYKNNILKFIFISSDKAVRPTNLMGATKRIGELIIQSFHQRIISNPNKNIKTLTNFSMVRFGNVIGSSGSVVPLFEKQIAEGGPITITDKKIIRYFMTIKEAVELVIQASYLAEGGEIFLLDMGKPISIYSLAQNMIRLSGLKIKDNRNPLGDIEIITTGLRPGEKLFEELLINAESEKTFHPLIFKANEKFLDYKVLNMKLEKLYRSLKNLSLKNVIKDILELVPEWKVNRNLK